MILEWLFFFYQVITATDIINNKTKKENNKQKRTKCKTSNKSLRQTICHTVIIRIIKKIIKLLMVCYKILLTHSTIGFKLIHFQFKPKNANNLKHKPLNNWQPSRWLRVFHSNKPNGTSGWHLMHTRFLFPPPRWCSCCSMRNARRLRITLTSLPVPVAFFFLTSCSALLISSSVTPWVERRVSRTRLAWALRCVSLSSSRVGGTNDLQ